MPYTKFDDDTSKGRRVAIYTRISPNPTKDDTTNQERELREFVKNQDLVLVAVYSDLLVSGSKKGIYRPQFKLMMDDARKRKFDILLFWSIDRLSREGVYETIGYLNQLTEYGVNYKSYTEQYFDSCGAFKDVVIAIMATVAKQERVKLIERTLAGLQTARDKGVILGRRKKILDIVTLETLHNEGMSLGELAKKYKVCKTTIYRHLTTRRDKPLPEGWKDGLSG